MKFISKKNKFPFKFENNFFSRIPNRTTEVLKFLSDLSFHKKKKKKLCWTALRFERERKCRKSKNGIIYICHMVYILVVVSCKNPLDHCKTYSFVYRLCLELLPLQNKTNCEFVSCISRLNIKVKHLYFTHIVSRLNCKFYQRRMTRKNVSYN